tara:strand:+ start:1000 stop:1269 length:270 start_codon:yes stop_codon:yes gene_type:complete
MENFDLRKYLGENKLLKEEITLELINGYEVIGPEENKTEAQNIVKDINKEMKMVFDEFKDEGESKAMDERDEVFDDYEGKLKKLGFKMK